MNSFYLIKFKFLVRITILYFTRMKNGLSLISSQMQQVLQYLQFCLFYNEFGIGNNFCLTALGYHQNNLEYKYLTQLIIMTTSSFVSLIVFWNIFLFIINFLIFSFLILTLV